MGRLRFALITLILAVLVTVIVTIIASANQPESEEPLREQLGSITDTVLITQRSSSNTSSIMLARTTHQTEKTAFCTNNANWMDYLQQARENQDVVTIMFISYIPPGVNCKFTANYPYWIIGIQ